MSQLPKNWKPIQLKNLLSFVLGGDWGKDPDYQDDDFDTVFCIRGTEFKNWSREKGITSVERKVKKTSAQKRELQLGDILIEISGGGPDQPVGRTVLIDEDALKHSPDYPKVCTNFIRLARPNDTIDSRYLNYYLRSFYASGEVVNYQGGSNNLRNLKFKEYETIKVPVAPRSEQKDIADKLDSVLAKVETAQARLDKIPTILKHFRQSVLTAATSGELTKDWREGKRFCFDEVSLKEVTGIDIGHAFKSKEFESDGVRLLRGQNIEPGSLRWSETKYFPEEKLEKYAHLFINKGDIILAMDRPIVSAGLKLAKAKASDLPCVLVQRVARFKPSSKILNDFLYYSLLAPSFSNYLLPNQTGSDIPHISGKQILEYKIKLPKTEEQIEIARRLEEFMIYAAAIEKQYRAAKLRVDKVTQSILARAFSGKLFSPISEDEREEVEVQAQNSKSKQTKTERTEIAQENTKAQADKIAYNLRSKIKVDSTPIIEDNPEQTGEVFTLLKSKSKGISAQALFDELSDNTFSAIDDLFSELKKLIEQKMVIQAGEGDNSTFKVTNK
ncbi:restriction endonuclease subunit S [Pseudoalteromonas sp. APC 3694]|uniref:restriction endonuclease subunit S n=1 Tax=Pseudoalteromonas sp. APC 3694 TaxID=3035202 RepID=UPI0025B2B429|nr:restriction endonuclease subunit S [Pseudoalteromonas sp. APC 3694]MDN3489723.1 restriction endonuclease subunit S [Pseudoalteromonas sp. APC 3694]